MVHTAEASVESIQSSLDSKALGVLEGDGDALEPPLEVEVTRETDVIGCLAKAGLLVEGELTEEGIGFGAEAATVFDSKGMVVGRQDELGSEHGSISLAFVLFGFAGGSAGADMGEMTTRGSSSDSGDVPVVSRIGSDEAVWNDPGSVSSSSTGAEASFDFSTRVGDAGRTVDILGDSS